MRRFTSFFVCFRLFPAVFPSVELLPRSRTSRYRCLASQEAPELLDALHEVLRGCQVVGVIESGWPLFSLLALLLPQRRLGPVESAWRAAPEVGPPAPEAEVLGGIEATKLRVPGGETRQPWM